MLKKVHITNFLSCKDTEIELDNVTALIGRNAAGKTNILKAIQWCARFAVGNVPFNDYVLLFNGLKTELSIEFLINNKVFKYEIKITTKYPDTKSHPVLTENLLCHENGEWKLIIKRSDNVAIHYNNKEETNVDIKPQSPAIVSMLSLLPEKTLNPYINKAFNYLLKIEYYTLAEDNKYKNSVCYTVFDPISSDFYEKWLSEDNKSESSAIMKLLHLWHVDRVLLGELEALIGKNGLNLISDIIINQISIGEADKKEYLYILRFNVENTAVSHAQLSYGTQRVLSILIALLYDKNNTLLIEQPEDGIHSGLLKKLLPLCLEYAAVYNKQIIITTHSPDVVNLLAPESIRLVRMTENGTKVSSLDKDQLPMIHDYMKDEGTLFDFIESMDAE